MSDILYCEWLKLKRSKIAVVGLLGTIVVPLLVTINRLQNFINNPSNPIALFDLYDGAMIFWMLLFAPLVMSVLAVYLIVREYSEKTLKTVFTVPISRKEFLQGKYLILFMIVMLFMVLSWLNVLILAMICRLFLDVGGFSAIIAITFLIKMLYGGVLVYMTIAPVIALSLRNKGFVTPFMTVAAVILINVVLSGSPIAGFIPWTAVYVLSYGQNGNYGCPAPVSFLIIVAVYIVTYVLSMRYFQKEDIL